MTRMVMPDSSCRQVDLESPTGRRTGRYTTGRNGTFEVTDAVHARRLRELGAFPASGGPPATAGFPCGCGFQALFRVCSRCGKDNGRVGV